MKKSYKAVIFDLDGTLLDTLSDLRDSVNHILENAGYPVRTTEEIRSFVGNGVGRLMELCVPQGRSNKEFDALLSSFREHYALHCNDKTAPYEHVTEVLQELQRRGCRLAIVSNKPTQEVETLRDIYFGRWVKTAVGEGPNIRRKPAPDTVLWVLEELGCNRQEAVLIGDSEVDVETARGAQVDCIAVTWGFRSKEELKKSGAAVFADTPLALLEMFD